MEDSEQRDEIEGAPRKRVEVVLHQVESGELDPPDPAIGEPSLRLGAERFGVVDPDVVGQLSSGFEKGQGKPPVAAAHVEHPQAPPGASR